MKIADIKVEYQQRRWSVGVTYEECQFKFRAGTGSTQEEAIKNAIEQVIRDVIVDRVGTDTVLLESALAAHNEERMFRGLPAVEFAQLPPNERSDVMDKVEKLKRTVSR